MRSNQHVWLKGYVAPVADRQFLRRQRSQHPISGLIDKVAIVRTSGIEAFDAGVVDAVRRAAPFGAAPIEILSEDGKVHLQWVIHRDPSMACSTYFMKPLLLKSAPSTAE